MALFFGENHGSKNDDTELQTAMMILTMIAMAMITVMMTMTIMMKMLMSRWSDEARQGARAGLGAPHLSARPQVIVISSSSL